ncbi:MAG: hypothetical protein WAK69_04825 [Rhodoplanes sp.]
MIQPSPIIMQLTPSQRDAIYRTDFLAFAQAALDVLEPNNIFEPNWHHEDIAQALVDSTGKKTRKYINAPPRSLKSFLVSIAWVAFKLGHEPTHKFICASYSRDLASHLAAQCRKLMQSDFYCRLFATRLAKITDDELVTTEGGFRIATSVGATLTGLGCDTLIVDDPLSADDAYSETARKNANRWFLGTAMTRLNDKRAGAIFVVTHRLHQEDLTAVLIEKGWDGLVFPAIAPREHGYPNRKPAACLERGGAVAGARARGSYRGAETAITGGGIRRAIYAGPDARSR